MCISCEHMFRAKRKEERNFARPRQGESVSKRLLKECRKLADQLRQDQDRNHN